ncbi:MAG: hypothetical protein U9P14_01675 [Gemmatimonadota bacterium]|nr:hypothetical protein [Gemmatimonadota bacterium]
MFDRIVTHDDFDGVVSAALAGYFLEIGTVVFTGPGDINRSAVPTGPGDIVCDLPYPLSCGMWFDHHQANLEEIELRGLDPASIPGRRSPELSCARVIRDYFAGEFEIEPEIEDMVAQADRIDSFAYESVEDWRRMSPSALIDRSIKLKSGRPAERRAYLKLLTAWLMDQSLEQVAGREEVISRADEFEAAEQRMLEIIEKNMGFLDEAGEIILLDFTGHSRRMPVVKNLAQLQAPRGLAVLEVNSLFERGVKTNDLGLSMSMNIAGIQKGLEKDLGGIMRSLNIGSGHAGAASGTIRCKSKQEMLKQKKKVLDRILEIWQSKC